MTNEEPKQAHIDWEKFEKLHEEWHKRMGDHDDEQEVDVSSQAPDIKEPVFDSTSTADYTSLSDLLDGTSIDDMYPEVLPLNPLPDVGETNTIDEPLDYEYPYEPMEPNQPVNLLDRGLAPDTTSTTSSTTTTTTTSMTTTTTTTSTTSTTVEETSAARLFGE